MESVMIPDIVRQLAGAHNPEPVWKNELGGITYRAGNQFIKWNPGTTGIDLEDERLRLQWAIKWHSVPKILAHGANSDGQWMVTEAMPGDGAVTQRWIKRPLEAARAIGRGLRLLHDALPVTECPFDWSVESRVGHRVSAEKIGMPPVDRLVVCHGDPCSPNTIIAPDGSPAGHVDLGQLGVADRWADLAVASTNLDYNYGAGWEDAFFEAYGIEPDEERITFYRFLWDNEDTIGR